MRWDYADFVGVRVSILGRQFTIQQRFTKVVPGCVYDRAAMRTPRLPFGVVKTALWFRSRRCAARRPRFEILRES